MRRGCCPTKRRRAPEGHRLISNTYSSLPPVPAPTVELRTFGEGMGGRDEYVRGDKSTSLRVHLLLETLR
eukprot:5727689-Pyramimonas_sp.AAC.2